ncbi:aldose 1-epimerase family protein [Brevibacterium zhoupengii]|uniref:aldose 1-epimerase family protein n=1 Tax=Brevibacterium zhoupengii TaxID=2898795 RepID=UPI001E399730|nr:aldose 1-epimerase family protein [Brevibacterium zhoupengii]
MSGSIELTQGNDSAVVSTRGAALLHYTVGDRPVVVEMSAFDGAVLAPWPNRIADGRYDFKGRSHQLPITEASRSTALHGLVAEVDWTVSARDADSVTLCTEISDLPGYPFAISLAVTYALIGHDDEGEDAGRGELRVRTLARNIGQKPAPFGLGFHPWIHPGAEHVDEAQLLIPADTWLETDDRLIPQAVRPFDTGTFIPADHGLNEASCLLCKDFRALRSLGRTVLDDAFGTPQRDDHVWSRVRLKGADDRTVVISMDDHFRTWQICTGDELGADHRRRAIAIEPMTCPPNAFATGSDYDVIGPRGELRMEWSIALR